MFGEDRPLHFEIGFGSGEHLADRADMLPDHGFIGAEPFLNGVATALGHIRDKHLANVRLWRGDALEVLQRVPDGALSFLYLLHPDPWPKARHAKRRMVNDRPVDLFAAKLKAGGEFRLATDDPTYLNWSLMVMQRHAAPVRMARRAAERLPRAAGRLDRDPLRRQVAPRGPPALLPSLPPHLSRDVEPLQQPRPFHPRANRSRRRGPCPTQRIRWPMSHWSAFCAVSPLKVTRISACPDSAPMKPLPFHCGNSLPL